MAVTTEILKSFSYMLRTGWKPHRTILFASWDGEELGLIGSTEFVEDHQTWIRKHLVTYLNTDVGQYEGYFFCPSLQSLYSTTRTLKTKCRSFSILFFVCLCVFFNSGIWIFAWLVDLSFTGSIVPKCLTISTRSDKSSHDVI